MRSFILQGCESLVGAPPCLLYHGFSPLVVHWNVYGICMLDTMHKVGWGKTVRSPLHSAGEGLQIC